MFRQHKLLIECVLSYCQTGCGTKAACRKVSGQ